MNSGNPYLPPRTQSKQTLGDMRAGSKWARRFLLLQLLVVTLGVAAAYFISIESIMVTGVALSVFGLLLSLFSRGARDVCYLACGLSGPAISILVFMLIRYNSWSPSQARIPVLLVGCLYAVGFLLLAGWAMYRRLPTSMSKRSEVLKC